MQVPSGWVLSEWNDIVTITHGKAQKNVEVADGMYPIYGSGGIIGRSSEFLCKAGSTIVGRKGTINRPIFTTVDFWNIDTAFGITTSESVNPRYLYYFCVGFNFLSLDRSTTIPSLTQKDLLSIKMPFPPLAEQHRIVEKIDALFSELDKGVESQQTIKQQLKTYRQAVLKWAFEGKLTQVWRQRNIDRGTNNVEAVENDLTSDLAEIPHGWRYVFLAKLGDLGRGKSRHRPRNDPKLFENGKYPFIQTGEVKAAGRYLDTYSTMYSDIGLKQSKLWPVGTLCITIAANIAETAFLAIEACFPDSIVGFTADDKLVEPKYVYYFIQSAKLRLWAFAPATAQKNINLTTLETLIVPYCSVDEQEEIINEIESRLSVCDKLEQLVDENLAKADALRQSILKQAFEGGLVPQDPNDEPAGKLLERIKAQRIAQTAPVKRRKHIG